MSGLGDIFKFEGFNLKNAFRKIGHDPERAFIGAFDPISSKAWGKVLGKNYEPIVDQWGGASQDTYAKAEAAGINTDPGHNMHRLARAVTSMFVGGAALGAAGGGAEAGAEAAAGAGSIGEGSAAGYAGLDAASAASLGGGATVDAGAASGGMAGATGAGSSTPAWMRLAKMGNPLSGGGQQNAQRQQVQQTQEKRWADLLRKQQLFDMTNGAYSGQ